MTGFPGLFEYSNYLTNDFFGVSILAIIFVVAFVHGSRENSESGFASASFITMLFSFFFGALNLINGNVVLVFVVMTAISAFLLKRNQ